LGPFPGAAKFSWLFFTIRIENKSLTKSVTKYQSSLACTFFNVKTISVAADVTGGDTLSFYNLSLVFTKKFCLYVGHTGLLYGKIIGTNF
jgi:hypothetical protein